MTSEQPPSDILADGLSALVTQAMDVLAAIRACHLALAEEPVPRGEREQELLRLMAARDALAPQLGEALLAALAAGARPRLAELAREPEPPREPEPALPFAVPVAPTAPAPPLPRPPRARPAEDLPDPDPVAALGVVLDRLGRPERVTDPGTAHRTIVRLLAVSEDPDAWLLQSQEMQQALVGLLSSIARHLQDEGPALDSEDDDDLRFWFSKMTAWSKANRPGYVRGLSRHNDPEHGSWLDDAEQWWWRLKTMREGADPNDIYRPSPVGRTWSSGPWQKPRRSEDEDVATVVEALWELEVALSNPTRDLTAALELVLDLGVGQRDPRLVQIFTTHAGRLAALPGFKTLKAAVTEQTRPDADDAEDDPGDDRVPSVVPPHWPGFARTEGRRAVIVGGDRRPEAADRIREAFRMAAVDWEETDPRRIAAVAARIRARTVDLLILLRAYIRHADSDVLVEACKDAEVPFVVVNAGYGVSQVKLAIERYLVGDRIEGRQPGP